MVTREKEKLVAVGFFVVSIFCLIASGILSAVLRRPAPIQYLMCVPCNSSVADLSELKKGRNNICCSTTPNDTAKMMSVMYAGAFKQIKSTASCSVPFFPAQLKNINYLSLKKPFAHLIGTEKVSGSKDGSDLTVVENWHMNSANKVDNGLRVANGRFLLPTSGFYKFYASIKFCTNVTTTFDLGLYRWDSLEAREVELLRQSQNAVPDQEGWWVLHGGLANVVCLANSGDRLYVKVRHPSTLVLEHKWHSVGVHLV